MNFIMYYSGKCVHSQVQIRLISPNAYGMAVRGASQVWLGMGRHGLGARAVLGSIPGGTPFFQESISNEI